MLDPKTYELFKWIAQTVHQGYHTDHPGNWQECPKSVCKAIHDYLSEHSLEQQVADVLMERPERDPNMLHRQQHLEELLIKVENEIRQLQNAREIRMQRELK